MNFIHQLRVVFNFDKRVTPTIEYSHGIVFAGGRGSTVERAISIFLLKTLSSPFLSHLLPPPLPLYYPTDPLYIYIIPRSDTPFHAIFTLFSIPSLRHSQTSRYPFLEVSLWVGCSSIEMIFCNHLCTGFVLFSPSRCEISK